MNAKRVVRAGLRRVSRPLIRAWYAGDGRVCPCCGGRFRTFRAFGTPRRENALCPGCGSLERHRLVWLFLREETDFFDFELRVLHVAPEPVFFRVLRSRAGYVPVDLESPLARVRVDVEHIPFRDGRFDAVLCNHVLEHVPDDRQAMRELCRVLKPEGWAILQCPVEPALGETFEDPRVVLPAERARLFGQADHRRRYGRDYPARLAAAGFAVKETDYSGRLGAGACKKYGLMADEILYFCQKQGACSGESG